MCRWKEEIKCTKMMQFYKGLRPKYFLRWKMYTRSLWWSYRQCTIHQPQTKPRSHLGFIFVCYAAMSSITNFHYLLMHWYTDCYEHTDTKIWLLDRTVTIITDTKNGHIAKYKYYKGIQYGNAHLYKVWNTINKHFTWSNFIL